jgi:hypothetical protein
LNDNSAVIPGRRSGPREAWPNATNPESSALVWIPGSLALRKIDASINFVAWLAPRNDVTSA